MFDFEQKYHRNYEKLRDVVQSVKYILKYFVKYLCSALIRESYQSIIPAILKEDIVISIKENAQERKIQARNHYFSILKN